MLDLPVLIVLPVKGLVLAGLSPIANTQADIDHLSRLRDSAFQHQGVIVLSTGIRSEFIADHAALLADYRSQYA